MITSDQHKSEPVVRRMEVFTGAGHRREWPAEVKARIPAETLLPGETASGVARRAAETQAGDPLTFSRRWC